MIWRCKQPPERQLAEACASLVSLTWRHACEQLLSIKAGLVAHWPSPDHCRHAVAFSCTSEQLVGSHTPQLSGQVRYMKPALLSHSPSRAHAAQSARWFLHACTHASHATGQLRSMNAGFFMHSPRCAYPGHSGNRSSQAGAQTPQLVGQFLSMKSTFESHSPKIAQAGHSEEVSYATSSHWPQACGHVRSMRYGFVSHSPSVAHTPHDGSRSVQKPPSESKAVSDMITARGGRER